jgi:glutamate racemase
MKHDVKIMIVACNTATALALSTLQQKFDFPVLGVVKPGVEAALKTTNNKKIGVIGTIGTISSEVYRKELEKIDKSVKVTSQACPLFVPLAEEGWTDKEATKLIAEEYLSDIKKTQVDTLILGCTHYPLLKNIIQETMSADVKIVDSAHAMAINTLNELKNYNLLTDRKAKGDLKLFVSDLPARFEVVAKRFLGEDISNVEKIHLDTI